MRLCIPETFGRRGAGLGNELYPWAKAFLASQVLNAEPVHPAWGLNQRHYHRDFGTSRLDWVMQGMARLALPVVRFDEAAYRATGKDDYQDAVTVFAAAKGLDRRRHFVFSAEGMWGGFLAIRKARVFVLAELLKARGAVQNVHAIMRQAQSGKILIAVHIRRGDFQDLNGKMDYRGRFNAALPLEWYSATCRSIKRTLGDQVQFLLLTDARPDEVRSFIDEFRPLTTFHLQQTSCSDLLLMSFADSIVCSVSSYSMWGAFLSNAPYIWFAPNLQNHDGYGSLWGHEDAQLGPSGATALNLARVRKSGKAFSEMSGAGRGIPVDFSGAVPASFCDRLLAGMRERAPEKDLILYGAVNLADTVELKSEREDRVFQ
jgi:hypothetical protein